LGSAWRLSEAIEAEFDSRLIPGRNAMLDRMTTEGGTEHDPVVSEWVEIAALMTAWGSHRDAGRWGPLEELFAPGATLELTWATATAAEFVAAARRHSSGPLRSKHVIGNPYVTRVGDRAIAETDAVLVNDHCELDLGAVTHARFLDRLVRTERGWRIAHRVSVYDCSGLTFPFGPTPVDQELIRRFPREYAGLAYLLARSGYQPSDRSPTRGSPREREILADHAAWLRGQDRP
jgi:SnoaL-like domain